ncbi:MAG TPA: 4-hydroxythreonine-4-phosphate dehydrogenase PdxA [Candidatus Elarobacter sp.]|jgi:4-hydroxythreonine-4-phosphate dehydrogenase|nr:4-hydroxythreonine-4-phosphate dehydrogenase PdxA [Candidatus Elarobacter sp.]
MTTAASPLALTIGDPNGIGPEIAVKALARLAETWAIPPILVGDAAVIRAHVERYAPQLHIHELDVSATPSRADGRHSAIEMYAVPRPVDEPFVPGTVSAAAGAATVAYVEAAISVVRRGAASGIVACPHSEFAVNAAGIPFSGYPSLLARLLGVPADRVFLMLVGGGLRIVHATLHERLRDAIDRLTPQLVEAAALAAHSALRALGIERPRLGLFGINPHAGEGALFGDDDERITIPAARRLRAAGIDVEGPFGADVLLARRDRDAYVAMYHDQGHVPVKMLAPREAVALSIGAGVVFASVGHGSAFDIAGRGVADPSAVLRSLEMLRVDHHTNLERSSV